MTVETGPYAGTPPARGTRWGRVAPTPARFKTDPPPPASGPDSGERMELVIPLARSADFPVGIYEAAARLVMPGETQPRSSNRLGFTLAPSISNLPQNVVRNGDGDALVSIDFTPELRPGQRATLLVGQQEVLPQSFAAPTASLDFLIVDAEPGDYLIRLRIDGIDSPIVDYASTPPTLFNQRLTIT